MYPLINAKCYTALDISQNMKGAHKENDFKNFHLVSAKKLIVSAMNASLYIKFEIRSDPTVESLL